MGNLGKFIEEGCYILNTDEIAGGASKLMFDLFNGSSNKKVIINAVYAFPKSDVAVTGVVSARFDFYKTNTKGTGGTGNSFRSPTAGALNISPLDSAAATLLDQGITGEDIEAGISARLAPTAGANKKHWLFPWYVFPEETAASAPLQQSQNAIPDIDGVDYPVLDTGEGLLVQQGSVASVNSFLFTVVFTLASKPGV